VHVRRGARAGRGCSVRVRCRLCGVVGTVVPMVVRTVGTVLLCVGVLVLWSVLVVPGSTRGVAGDAVAGRVRGRRGLALRHVSRVSIVSRVSCMARLACASVVPRVRSVVPRVRSVRRRGHRASTTAMRMGGMVAMVVPVRLRRATGAGRCGVVGVRVGRRGGAGRRGVAVVRVVRRCVRVLRVSRGAVGGVLARRMRAGCRRVVLLDGGGLAGRVVPRLRW
jgi:hypothetical protein